MVILNALTPTLHLDTARKMEKKTQKLLYNIISYKYPNLAVREKLINLSIFFSCFVLSAAGGLSKINDTKILTFYV